MLVDGPLVLRKRRHQRLLLVHEAILLQEHPRALELGVVHAFHDRLPMRPFLGFAESPTLVLVDQLLRRMGLHPVQCCAGLAKTPCGKPVGVPVVVDVVLVFVGARHTEHDPRLFGLGPIHPLCPETRHPEDDLPPSGCEVLLVSRITDIVVDGIDHGPIAVDLLERDLPFIVAFLAIHGDHGVQCCTGFKTELLCIYNRTFEMLTAVYQQLLGDPGRVRTQIEGQAIGFRIPITRPAVLLSSEPFGTNVQAGVVASEGLVQMKNVEPDGLLSSLVSVNGDVGPLPDAFPRHHVILKGGIPSPVDRGSDFFLCPLEQQV